jgi:ubiquitin-protein ligase
MDKTDYVEFRDVARQLAKEVLKTPVSNTKGLGLHRCCTLWACQVHGKGIGDDDIHEHLAKGDNYEDSICLDLVYKRTKLEKRGRLRIRHIFDIMDFAKIKYDKGLLPQTFWDLKSDLMIEDANHLQELIETLTVEKVVYADEDPDPTFRLPRWLQDEFKPSEILLFKHQFKLIDIDGGGSIDVDELMQLCESLGTRITLDEANAMMEEYDVDKSGSIDFIELMMLMFKIKHGTIDLQSNALANAMVEAKTQIRVFEEIEEIGREPPPYCSIYSYGGAPVKCDYLIEAPEDSLYYGGKFLFRVVFLPGYPFKIPDTFLFNRVFHPNFVTQLDGRCEVPHMNDKWNATWDTRQLLEHIVSLFRQPDLELLPEEMVFAAKTWSWLREDERRVIKKAEDAEKKAEEDAEKERLDNALKSLQAVITGAAASSGDKKDIPSVASEDKSNNNTAAVTHKDEPKEVQSKGASDIKDGKGIANISDKGADDVDEKSVSIHASNAKTEGLNDETVLNPVVAEEKLPSARSTVGNKQDKDAKGDEKGDAAVSDEPPEEEDEHDRDSALYLGAGDLETIICKLSRQEQMHVNVIALYVDSLKTHCGDGPKDKYFEVVKFYMEKYAHEYKEPQDPEPEPVVEEVKEEEYSGFWDDEEEEEEEESDDGLGPQDYNNDSSTLYGGDGPITQLFGPSIDSVPQDLQIGQEPSLISAVSIDI